MNLKKMLGALSFGNLNWLREKRKDITKVVGSKQERKNWRTENGPAKIWFNFLRRTCNIGVKRVNTV
jgi:hypothetical protein